MNTDRPRRSTSHRSERCRCTRLVLKSRCEVCGAVTLAGKTIGRVGARLSPINDRGDYHASVGRDYEEKLATA